MNTTENVMVSDSEGVRTITLNRPERRNALTVSMYEALEQAVVTAGNDVQAVLFLGNTNAFSAGNDLEDFQANPPRDTSAPVFRFMQAVVRSQRPLVAGVCGLAVGIGTTLLLHCDLVVAGRSARFLLPFVKLGLVPEFGSSRLLVDAMGRRRAARHLLLGEPFDAQTALAFDIASEVIDDECVEERARAFAKELAAQPPIALARARALIRPDPFALEELIEREGHLLVEGLVGTEFADAAAAFLARQRA